MAEAVQSLARGLQPFFQGPENSSSLSLVFFTGASASACLHCVWGQGQEMPATTKNCSCSIPGLIQNKTY